VFLFYSPLYYKRFVMVLAGIPEEGAPLVVTVPDAQRPLDRIITEDGVCPFFYNYL